jgi:hypothetical protein
MQCVTRWPFSAILVAALIFISSPAWAQDDDTESDAVEADGGASEDGGSEGLFIGQADDEDGEDDDEAMGMVDLSNFKGDDGRGPDDDEPSTPVGFPPAGELSGGSGCATQTGHGDWPWLVLLLLVAPLSRRDP